MHPFAIACFTLLAAQQPAADVVYMRTTGRDDPRYLFIQRLPGGTPRAVASPDPPFYGPVELGAFSPDGKKLLVTSRRVTLGVGNATPRVVLHPETTYLWLLDLATAKLTRIDTGDHQFASAQWSPNGRYLSSMQGSPGRFGETRSQHLAVLDTTTGKTWVVDLGSVPPDKDDPIGGFVASAWMPDSTGFVVGRLLDRYSVPLKGGKAKRLPKTGAPYVSFENVSPAPYDLSPDGQLVVLHDSALGKRVGRPLQIQRVGGKRFRVPLADQGDPGRAAWAPNSKRVAFCSWTGYASGDSPIVDYSVVIYSVDVYGRKTHRLFGPRDVGRGDGGPHVVGWSGDGEWVIVREMPDRGRTNAAGNRHFITAYQWQGKGEHYLGTVEGVGFELACTPVR